MIEEKNYWWLVCIGLLFFVFIIVLSVLQDKYYPVPPFSNGLYENTITGRVENMHEEKDKMIIRLTSDSLYYFIPLIIVTPQRFDFPEVVHRGDSLWKFPQSNVLYSQSSNGQIYRWTFILHDRFNRLYPDSCVVDSSIYRK